MHFIECYIDFRQYKKYLDTKLPVELQGIVTEEKFNKSQAYGRDRMYVYHSNFLKYINLQ